jgi:zinc D-Ala-D-Ala carboxypeptidase
VLTLLEQRMGFELTINSGYRDPEHNRDVGGVEGSEHTHNPAEGADVLCKRSSTRYKMLKELFSMGVRRIGIGQTFIHVGVAKEKPQHVLWHYYPEATT